MKYIAIILLSLTATSAWAQQADSIAIPDLQYSIDISLLGIGGYFPEDCRWEETDWYVQRDSLWMEKGVQTWCVDESVLLDAMPPSDDFYVLHECIRDIEHIKVIKAHLLKNTCTGEIKLP